MAGDRQHLIERAGRLLQAADRLVALTGAGVSTPSGIPDFRSPDSGLWRDADPMAVASLEAFRRRPLAFYDWLRPLLEIGLAARPNPAHEALRDLEKFGPLETLITQNIDLLHSLAGSVNVLEIHGHLRELICLRCGAICEATPHLHEFVAGGTIPRCSLCAAVLKPRVILFGELLSQHLLNRAAAAVTSSDVLLIAGSSLEVYPVNELPWLARQTGSRLIIVNLQPTPADEIADVVIRGNVTEVLPALAASFQPQTL